MLPGGCAGPVPSTEGLPALGRAALGFTNAHYLAKQQPLAISLSPNSFCYINCIIDTLKKLNGLFIPRQPFKGQNVHN